jgi:hypothetical protein
VFFKILHDLLGVRARAGSKNGDAFLQTLFLFIKDIILTNTSNELFQEPSENGIYLNNIGTGM